MRDQIAYFRKREGISQIELAERVTAAGYSIHVSTSVKTVPARLCHKTADETLNTYAHLWPDSDARTREAVTETFSDFLRTSGVQAARNLLPDKE
ncbi:hypothetical protein [Luteococcus peritonei]|uniref:XRE family transcriptional regulator n=1 Tax=Luteococcus peritonei TaxID=88874 RepID=A0ABW4RYE1_9ACTN